MKMSRVSIFFKEAQFLTSRRSELYGTTDFLANCGGLLGLFMGVSTLSIVELVYFCTVRLISNLRMRRKTRKELSLAARKEAWGICKRQNWRLPLYQLNKWQMKRILSLVH